MTADDVVAAWALARFRAAQARFPYDHLGQCPDAVVGVRRTEWECGCLSGYTRDDQWFVVFTVSCPHGESRVTSTETAGSQALPRIIAELMELDRGGFECAYDGED